MVIGGGEGDGGALVPVQAAAGRRKRIRDRGFMAFSSERPPAPTRGEDPFFDTSDVGDPCGRGAEDSAGG
jgi:hypothetical protein